MLLWIQPLFGSMFITNFNLQDQYSKHWETLTFQHKTQTVTTNSLNKLEYLKQEK